MSIAVSALSGEGVEALSEAIAKRLQQRAEVHRLKLSAGDGTRMAWLHAHGEMLDQRMDGETVHLAVRLSPDNWARFQTL